MSSIPTPLDEPLRTFFAIQLKQGEGVHHVAEAVLRAAKDVPPLFRRLEVMDKLSIGTGSYVRMRTDMAKPSPVLDKLYNEGRAVVSSTQGGDYTIRIPGGRIGKVSNLVMHAVAKTGQSQMFQGTKIKHWERQFGAA
jgi:hypothetical protein